MDTKTIEVLDLRGVRCPMNWVCTKLRMEDMETGERIEVLLDDGESIRNVPRSLKDDGHRLLKVRPEEDYFRLLIEKV